MREFLGNMCQPRGYYNYQVERVAVARHYRVYIKPRAVMESVYIELPSLVLSLLYM